MERQNSNIPEVLENLGNRFIKARQTEWYQCGAQFGVIDTQFFLPPPTHPPMGQKTSLVNFKHKKLRLQLTIRMALVQDINLTTKNCVCTTSKSINQIQTGTGAVMKHTEGGGVVKSCVFSPQNPKKEVKI